MKTINSFLAVAFVFGVTACTSDALWEEENALNDNGLSTIDEVTITANDFEEVDTCSRTALGNTSTGGLSFAWAATDVVGIYPDTGSQVEFPILNSGVGASKATFSGGGWGLKSSSTYYAYFPYRESNNHIWEGKTKIPVSYAGQKQEGNDNPAHLGQYDFMATGGATPERGEISFHFNHLNAIARISLPAPDAHYFNRLILVSEEPIFVETGTIDLTKENPSITPDKLTSVISLELTNFRYWDNGNLTFYLMMAPTTFSNVTAILRSDVNTVYTDHYYNLDSKEMLAGKIYTINGTPKETLANTPSKVFTINLSEAGTLPFVTDRVDFKTLKIVGDINGTDVRMLMQMSQLEYLDLSEATIVSGGEYYYYETVKYHTTDYEITQYMFDGHKKLKTVLLPKNTTKINRAFRNCPSLETIEIPDNVIEVIDSFYGKSLRSVVVGKNVKYIGSCFESDKLEYLSLSEGLETLGSLVARSIEHIELPSTLKNIDYIRCPQLTSIDIPSGVKAIPKKCFENCYSLAEVKLHSGELTELGDFCFYKCGLKSIEIPEGVKEIGIGAFDLCSSLKKAVLPEGITTISCFGGCKSLTDINIPSSVTTIDGFSGCESLSDIVLPENLTTIGNNAFYETALTKIVIPAKVTSIGDRAFEKTPIIEVRCYAKEVPSLGTNGFDKSYGPVLYVPKGCSYNYELFANWYKAFGDKILEMDE